MYAVRGAVRGGVAGTKLSNMCHRFIAVRGSQLRKLRYFSRRHSSRCILRVGFAILAVGFDILASGGGAGRGT